MGVTLFSRLPEIAATMPSKVDAVVQKTALDIEASAKGVAPVDTGALQNSIQAKPTGLMAAVVETGMEYAMYVEYGTYKMAAQPYMIPSAEQHRGPFRAAIAQVVAS